jgi:TonB-linked SusC/RagA family outer membrane protein
MRKFIILFITALIPLHTLAQSAHISGTIEDEYGVPMAGVNVMIKGTKKGTMSDVDGNFSVSTSTFPSTLTFSFLGMETLEIPVSKATDAMKVIMKEGGLSIEQTVITGYTQTSIKKITGSVGVLTSKNLEDQAKSSIDAMLQGQLAGVAVTATTGQPGRNQEIRIRGQSTLTGDASPLWVVDGVPLQGELPQVYDSQLKTGGLEDLFINGVGDINPNDIENISILKDASAAAIYGSRAANGVIVITTKRGREGPMRVNYSGNVSVVMAPQRDGNLMNSAQKIAWEQELWDEFSVPGLTAGKDYPKVGIVGMVRSGYGRFADMAGNKAAQDAYLAELSKNTTDWFGLIFRNSVSTNHHVNISGGGQKYNYYVALGYNHDAGLLIKDSYDRYNVKSNFTMTPNKVVKIDFGLDFSSQGSKSPNLSSVDPFHYAYYANPYEAPYNADGSYRADETWYNLGLINGSSVIPVYDKGYNIMRELDQTSNQTNNYATTARAGIDIRICKPLKFVGLASYSFANNRSEKINLKDTYAAWENQLEYDKMYTKSCYGSIIQNSYSKNAYMLRGHFEFNQSFSAAHQLQVIAGAEIRAEDSKTLYSKRLNYDANTNTTSMPQPPTGSSQLESWLREVEQLSGEWYSKSRYASFYASADYFILNRYVINGSFRMDGSSYFGSAKQFNPTWSAGAAWHIAEEPFMEWSRSVLDRLTLRAATGYAGNINNGVSPQLVMSYWEQQYRRHDGQTLPMATFSGAPNPNLTWEKAQDYKLSLDFGLFGDRLSGIVEGYMRHSTDVVVSSKIPSSTGYTYQKFNSADILNKGIEFTLNGRILDKNDFRLNASFNLSYNINKVLKYDSPDKLTASTRYWEGYPTDALFIGLVDGLNYEGLYQYKLRPDAVIQGVQDYQVADNYRFYLGTTTPPFTGGFNLSFSWKSLTLSCFGAFSWGSKTFEQMTPPGSWSTVYKLGAKAEVPQTYFSDLYSNHFNVTRDRTDRWTPTNRDAKYPRIYDAFGTSEQFSQRNPTDSNIIKGAYVKDNSYLRIKNIILSYAFPKKITDKMKMTSLKMNLTLNNFFTITDYDGLDPETPGAVYPVSRSVMFGLNVGF